MLPNKIPLNNGTLWWHKNNCPLIWSQFCESANLLLCFPSWFFWSELGWAILTSVHTPAWGFGSDYWEPIPHGFFSSRRLIWIQGVDSFPDWEKILQDLLIPRLGTCTMSLSPNAFSQSKSQGQRTFGAGQRDSTPWQKKQYIFCGHFLYPTMCTFHPQILHILLTFDTWSPLSQDSQKLFNNDNISLSWSVTEMSADDIFSFSFSKLGDYELKRYIICTTLI